MTKELLEQYPDLCAEIKELEEQIRRGVSDTVSGSSPDYPYTQHPITIKGEPPHLRERLETLKKQKANIEAFVAGLPRPEKRIIESVIKHGTKWNVVRRALDSNKSSDALRMEYKRIFEKF